ncbi:phospholipase A [Rhodoferax saidenbachensis]|nr:phospholipase A [Rhodoferax saidenbachensis]
MHLKIATFLIAACALSTGAIAQNDTKNGAWASANPDLPASSPPPVQVSCKNPHVSPLSSYWELEPASDCGTFGLRGYRPISLSVIGSDSVNTAPSSPTPGHTATFQPYNTAETRVQLSVRTKVAQGLLTGADPTLLDSVWFSYSQQSYWQLFNNSLSRPFRSTDHEPEITYILPIDAQLSDGWRLRYVGVSANHQSNGQTLPLSRSWNRVIARAGMEYGNTFVVNANLWQRMPEDSDSDDNPDIADYVGRAEVTGAWNLSKNNTLTVALRHSLKAEGNGSIRLGWLRKVGTSTASGERSGLRFHTEVFSGYGDSLLDYNRKRTVLSVGLTLLDW